ncbi:MAG: hypothetical protein R2941_06615 [Desulfobacterales bacterium]
MGLATNCRINRENRFARRTIFIPDLPKGYQISQYELPLCEAGHIEIDLNGQKKARGHYPDSHGKGAESDP